MAFSQASATLSTPFGATSRAAPSPFGRKPESSNPFGGEPTPNPFAAKPAGQNPFQTNQGWPAAKHSGASRGNNAPSFFGAANPFGSNNRQPKSNPNSTAYNPFAQKTTPANAFRAALVAPSPFGAQAAANPFGELPAKSTAHFNSAGFESSTPFGPGKQSDNKPLGSNNMPSPFPESHAALGPGPSPFAASANPFAPSVVPQTSPFAPNSAPTASPFTTGSFAQNSPFVPDPFAARHSAKTNPFEKKGVGTEDPRENLFDWKSPGLDEPGQAGLLGRTGASRDVLSGSYIAKPPAQYSSPAKLFDSSASPALPARSELGFAPPSFKPNPPNSAAKGAEPSRAPGVDDVPACRPFTFPIAPETTRVPPSFVSKPAPSIFTSTPEPKQPPADSPAPTTPPTTPVPPAVGSVVIPTENEFLTSQLAALETSRQKLENSGSFGTSPPSIEKTPVRFDEDGAEVISLTAPSYPKHYHASTTMINRKSRAKIRPRGFAPCCECKPRNATEQQAKLKLVL